MKSADEQRNLFEGRHVLAQRIFVGARHQAIMSVQRPCTV